MTFTYLSVPIIRKFAVVELVEISPYNFILLSVVVNLHLELSTQYVSVNGYATKG